MRSIEVTRNVDAPQSAVWAVLADFPNIADWNRGVTKSYATGERHDGIGATRHCDLAPLGGLEETIAEWQPEERLVITIDSASKLPIARGEATFSLAAVGSGTTTTSIDYAYEPRFGAVGSLVGRYIDRRLVKGFEGFLADLEVAARSHAPDRRRAEGSQ